MSVHPIKRKFDELQLTLNSADVQFLGVAASEAISLSCQISSLPSYNCNVIINSVELISGTIGEIAFKVDKPIASAELDLENSSFENLKFLILRGLRLEPLWPFLDLLVATAGFYGSVRSRKMSPMCQETKFCHQKLKIKKIARPDRYPPVASLITTLPELPKKGGEL